MPTRQGTQEPAHKIWDPAGEKEEHGDGEHMVHPGHPPGHWRGGGGGGGGGGGRRHCISNGEQNGQVASQKHQKGQDETSDRFCDEQPHVELPTLLALLCVVSQDGTVEVRSREDGGYRPQDATDHGHGPRGPSKPGPHGPQQTKAPLQGHGTDQEGRGVQPQAPQEHDQAAESQAEFPAVVVGEVPQHEGGAQEQHQISKGQVQDINAKAAGGTCFLAAASTDQVAMAT